jgi:choline dehydrogenase
LKVFDFVIIGGGSADCVLADKLSASGEHSVCLLEAAKAHKNWLNHLPIGIYCPVTKSQLKLAI